MGASARKQTVAKVTERKETDLLFISEELIYKFDYRNAVYSVEYGHWERKGKQNGDARLYFFCEDAKGKRTMKSFDVDASEVYASLFRKAAEWMES